MAANQLLEDGGTKPNKDVLTPVMVRPPHPPIYHTVIDSVLRDNNSAILSNAIQCCTVWFMHCRWRRLISVSLSSSSVLQESLDVQVS